MTNFKIERLPFEADALSVWAQSHERNTNWPVVYTLTAEKAIYVGETANVANRLQQHLVSAEKKNLKRVNIVFNEKFNKSVCLDLESHLIRYFHADGNYQVLNRNDGIIDADYYDRASYRESFDQLFDELLKEGMLTRSVPDIVNSNLFKFSPFKALSSDQAVAVESVLKILLEDLKSCSGRSLVVQGGPGTGKTIVAIYLMKLLLDIAKSADDEMLDRDTLFSGFFNSDYRELLRDFRVGLVIPQQSLRKTIETVFQKTPGLDKFMVLTPFEVGESTSPYDLLIVDEAHRLGQRANQASAAQNAKFTKINEALFGEDRYDITQMDWIRVQSRHQLYLIDSAQSVKPADVPKRLLDELTTHARSRGSFFRLMSQMRIEGGSDYIDYVGRVLDGTEVTPETFGSYSVRFFDDVAAMRSQILQKDEELGLCRLVAGYAWPWVSKENPELHDIVLDGVGLTWNRTASDWINSPTSVEEVGSIHTVQGYDLNYAGVIIGADLGFDPVSQTMVFHRQNYHDKKGKENNPRLGVVYSDDDLLEYVKNIYRVLLTRGIRGTFVYVVDPHLRAYLRPFFTEAK